MNFQIQLAVDTVDQAFPRLPLCMGRDTTIREVFVALRANSRGCVLVCEDERLVGIFTERDALRLMVSGADLDQPVERVMQDHVVTVSSHDTVADAIIRMSQGGYRRMPIVDDDGRPTGVLSVKTILHYLVDHFPSVVYTLPPEPHHCTQEREGA